MIGRRIRHLSVVAGSFLLFILWSSWAVAAPYAAMVMDARTGEVLHEENAHTRLHPASLTKMMTLYIAFEAERRGEITLDTRIRVSQNAAREQPSKLGLRPGQRIALRYLIRAAAIKSANDAATAIAEGISGSEGAFIDRMNRTARALGMTRTNFRNAHGLTQERHLSTARDMTILGRHMIYDFPEYYHLFSRRTTVADGRTLRNTNHRLLDAYRGADGIKTGYTRAAGFNLVASAERGSERVIATVFGGRSSATRNARVAELLDLGFRLAPSQATVRPPRPPSYGPFAPSRSIRPAPRPAPTVPEDLLLATKESVGAAVEAVTSAAAPAEDPTDPVPLEVATVAPPPRPVADATERIASVAALATETPAAETPEAAPVAAARVVSVRPRPIPPQGPRVVRRPSADAPREWIVAVGAYSSRWDAERAMLRLVLRETAILTTATRTVAPRNGRYSATFEGLSQRHADRLCQRLSAQDVACEVTGPEAG